MGFNEDVFSTLAAKTDLEDNGYWLSLSQHSLDTAEIMDYLFSEWMPLSAVKAMCGLVTIDVMRKVCRFVGYIHDIGKSTNSFQVKILKALPEIRNRLIQNGFDLIDINENTITHSAAGECILLDAGVPYGIASCVGAHHGKPQGKNEVKPDSQFDVYYKEYYGCSANEDQWRRTWDHYVHNAIYTSGFACVEDIPDITMKQQVVLTGLLIMSDWIASNTRYFPLCRIDGSEFIGGKDRTDKAWNTLDLPKCWEPQRMSMTENDFSDVFGFSPNPVQQMVLEIVNGTSSPGVYILEAQMGVGKTEAALAAAEVIGSKTGSGGLFFGLPTQATSNGIFPRLLSWADNQSENSVHSIRLAHAAAELNEDYTALFHGSSYVSNESGLTVHSWFSGRKVALLSDFVIGTVDQLLMAALKQKHVMLRHLGLAGKVVIIDEVHAYDAYMNQYLDMALSWMGAYHVPVILLSATLPPARRIELIKAYIKGSGASNGFMDNNVDLKTNKYPVITWSSGVNGEIHQVDVDMGEESRTVHIKTISDDERVGVLQRALSNGGCACVICNTVKRAQEMAGIVHKQMPDTEIILLHAQYMMPDRAEIEKTLLERIGKKSAQAQRNNLIVIGTQVLEQSLDIDADIMITDLCPMDLLLQRIGRLHRHRHHDDIRPAALRKAECYVVCDDESIEPGSKAVYGEWLLVRTRDILPESIRIPQDIPSLVTETYEIEGIERSDYYDRLIGEYRNAQKTKKQNADVYRVAAPIKETVPPKRNIIDGWLSNVETLNDIEAEASVRDGDQSIEVILLRKHKGGICYINI